jgi:hypothetical protein
VSTIGSPTTEIMDRAFVMVQPNPVEYMYTAYIPSISPSNPYNVQDTQLKDILTVPDKYEEAYYHPDTWCRDRWREAIRKELEKMSQLKVWHPVGRQDIPSGRKTIKCKWVFDIKRTGVFRARLVACGYSQVPGVIIPL